MLRKTVSGIMLTLLIASMLTLGFNIQPVKASGTIYIRADGSIEPSDAPISSFDNVTYIFTGNISDSIVIERDNIVVDGAGYTIQGTGASFSKGIDLTGRKYVEIRNMQIKGFWKCIWLWYSSSINIHGNNITASNEDGVWLYGSLDNSIYGNNITASDYSGIELYLYSNYNSIYGNNITASDGFGILLQESSNNDIYGNNIENNYEGIGFYWYSDYNSLYENSITNNKYGIGLAYSSSSNIYGNTITANNINGIWLYEASNNKFYHNNLIANAVQVYDCVRENPYINPSINVWDDDYPSGGNYWSDYTGVDSFNGLHQNRTGSDGIGDTAYVVDMSNQDNYPLMHPWVPFENQTIYIRADGSIDPSGAPIQREGNLYTLTGNITSDADGIVIERNNMTLDGAGYTLQGGKGGFGIYLVYRRNVTIRNMEIKAFGIGIYLYGSSKDSIVRNTITNNGHGIWLYESLDNGISGNTIKANSDYGIYLGGSSNNIISGNTITNNNPGIVLGGSSNNIISGNTITNNWYGIILAGSSNNHVYHNNFVNNMPLQAFLENYSVDVWDDGYPSGGNYWSDYTGIDLKRGPNQDKPGSDGIGDTPYIIDDYNRDDYPLMEPWAPAPPKQKKIEVKIVSPKKGEIFFISPAPKMPIINCKAQISGISPDPTYASEFSWEANLSYTWKHRGELRFQSFLFKESAIGGAGTPDFGSIIMGGDMNITVATTIGGIKYEDSVLIEIRGENPDKETVKAELGELKYQILAYMESKPKWCHFDKNGLPIFGPPSGYGLMQLDPPPSYSEIWDWKANVKAGKEHFDEDIEAARGYATYVRDYYKGKEPVTDLSETQILTQAYYSYNAGRAYWKEGKWWPYYVWDTEKDEWVVNKDASSQGKKYADTAMAYLNDILQGKLPKNW